MRGRIDHLIVKDCAVIDRLEFRRRLLDFLAVLAVVIREVILVVFFKRGDGFHCIITSLIFGSQYICSFLTNGRDGWVNHAARHGVVN